MTVRSMSADHAIRWSRARRPTPLLTLPPICRRPMTDGVGRPVRSTHNLQVARNRCPAVKTSCQLNLVVELDSPLARATGS